MTRDRSVQRPRRGRSRGQSIVFVAIGGVAMIAIVGLALDGGTEVGKYRLVRNAADAGALAAGRLIFDGTQTCTPTNYSSLLSAATTEVRHNGASIGDVNGGSQLTCNYLKNAVLDGGGSTTAPGAYAHSALATVTAGLSAGVASVTASLTATEATATGKVKTVASGGSTTSGQVDLASVNATVTTLGIPVSATGNLLCYQSSRTYAAATNGQWSGQSTCPVNSLSAVSAILGTLGSITGSAGVNLSPESTNSLIGAVSPYNPHTIASNALTSVNVADLGTTVTAGAANVVSQIGNSATVLASNDFNLATVNTGLLTLAVSAPLVTIHSELDYDSSSGVVSAPSPTCDPGSITIGGTSYSILSSCHISGLPPSLLGVTLKDFSSSITTSGCPGLTCSEHGCFLELSVLSSVANVCLGEFDLSAAASVMATPSGSSGYSGSSTTLLGGVLVDAHTDSPTYFLNILGWRNTHPSAQTGVSVLQVSDESDAAFSNAAYAIPTVATNMDCPCATAPLSVGHDYYLYGSSMQSYSPVDKFASSWQGRVSASSGHKVGSILSSVTGTGSGPGVYQSGGNYYLLPVIDPSSAVVQYYAVFKTVSGHSAWGQLVNTIPVQADAGSSWMPDAGGGAAAMTLKVTE